MKIDVGYLASAFAFAYGILVFYDLCLDLRLARRRKEKSTYP